MADETKERRVPRWDKKAHGDFVRAVVDAARKYNVLVPVTNDKGKTFYSTGMQWPSPVEYTFEHDGKEMVGTAGMTISINLNNLTTPEAKAANRQDALATVGVNMTREEKLALSERLAAEAIEGL